MISKSSKRKTKNPCSGCGMGGELCFCDQIPRLTTRTRLSLIIHVREMRKPTNTGQLAVRALANSNLIERGAEGASTSLEGFLDPAYQPLILFPSEEAQPLTNDFIAGFNKPVQLIVTDGNWRQASRAARRYAELTHIPKVVISEKNPETQFLRKESTEYGMATLQAIAYAMMALEGRETGEALLQLYHLKLSQTLQARGVKACDKSN